MIEFVLWVIGMTILWSMINHGFRIATRIAVATEMTAANVAILQAALTPEAQDRASANVAKLAEYSAAMKERGSKPRIDTVSTF